MFDEVLELFKGQASETYLFRELTYKELLLFREIRVERLTEERERIEKERKEMESKQRRDSIMRK